MRSISLLIFLPLASTSAQTITGTVFNDYNSNGIRDFDSPGFYESYASNVPITLHDCNDVEFYTQYTNSNGIYKFWVEDGCYYVRIDSEAYGVGPYVMPGDVTQIMTNQIYPESGKSADVYMSGEEEVVMDVGLVEQSVSAVQETTSTTSTEVSTTSSQEATNTFSTTENYSEVFFANDENEVDGTADMIDMDDISDAVDTPEDSTDIIDGVSFVDAIDTIDKVDSSTMATVIDAVEESSTADKEALFGDEVDSSTSSEVDGAAIVEPTTSFLTGGNETEGSSNASSTINDLDVEVTGSSSSVAASAESVIVSDEDTDSIATATTSSISTAYAETAGDSVNENEGAIIEVGETQDGNNETVGVEQGLFSDETEEAQDDEEIAAAATEKPTSSPTESDKQTTADEQPEKEADKSPAKETGKETNPSSEAEEDVDVTSSDKDETSSKTTSKPTAKPTTCIGCELSLASKVRIQLDNIEEQLNDDSKSLFEEVCASFLEEQLSIATPPITNLNCVIVEESFEAESRSLRAVHGGGYRKLSQVYLADVDVTGTALSTPSHQTPESIKFKELCVGTFTVQGFLFVRALKEAEGDSASEDTVFQSVENARGVMTYDASEASTGEQIDDPSNPEGGWLSTGVLAAIAAGSVFCAACFLVFMVVRARSNRKHRYSDMDEKSGSAKTNKSGKDLDSAIYDEFPELAGPSPTNSNGTSSTKSSTPTLITPVSIRSNTKEVEVDMIPDSFSGGQGQEGMSSILNSRVRRDVLAPPGKLGIMVANTAGFVSTWMSIMSKA